MSDCIYSEVFSVFKVACVSVMNHLYVIHEVEDHLKLKSLCHYSVSEPEQHVNKELKGVAEEDALRKLLSSGEEDEEEEEVRIIMSFHINKL